MSENHSFTPAMEQDNNPGYLLFQDRLEEPPFVYLGISHPSEIATALPSHVYSFEKAWLGTKQVKVYELLGMPAFRSEKDLENVMLDKELTKIIDLMLKNNIYIDIPAGEDNRDIYRYITETVFEQEVDDLKLGGLGRHFFYR